MASSSREWSVPAPVRALLWWPAISFVLVIVAPSTIEGTIVASGVLLVVIGGFTAVARKRLRDHRSAAASRPSETAAPDGQRAAPPADQTTDLPAVRIGPTAVPAGPDAA